MTERVHLKRSIISFSEAANSQEEKGIEKYGKPLDPFDNYDWLEMAKEELVDGFKYLEAEKVKRDMVIKNIREILEVSGDKYINVLINKQLDKLEAE